MCSQLAKFQSGGTDPATLLKGMSINVAFTLDVVPFYMKLQTALVKLPIRVQGVNQDLFVKVTQPISGLFYDFMDKLSTRGGFTINYVLTPNITSFPSNNDYLNAALPHVDIYAGGVIADTSARRGLGYGFTFPLQDFSVICVARQSLYVPPVDLWFFLNPLDSEFQPVCASAMAFLRLTTHPSLSVQNWCGCVSLAPSSHTAYSTITWNPSNATSRASQTGTKRTS